MAFTDRLQHAWNAFLNRDPTYEFRDHGMISTYKPDRVRFTRGTQGNLWGDTRGSMEGSQ